MVLQKEDSLWFKNTFGDDPICIWVLLANDLCMLCPIHEIAVSLITCSCFFNALCVLGREADGGRLSKSKPLEAVN